MRETRIRINITQRQTDAVTFRVSSLLKDIPTLDGTSACRRVLTGRTLGFRVSSFSFILLMDWVRAASSFVGTLTVSKNNFTLLLGAFIFYKLKEFAI